MLEPIRLLLVDDDPGWIAAMQAYLHREPDLQVVAVAGSSEEALQQAAHWKPDLALLDINLSEQDQGQGTDGIALALDLAELQPGIKLLMLTSLEDEAIIRQAFTAGALSYVNKQHYRDLPPAIRSVYRASLPMEVLVRELARLRREEQLAALTPAERDIFELLELGLTHAQMEAKLVKAESTLKNQINRILRKLGARTGKEAVERVRRKGIDRR